MESIQEHVNEVINKMNELLPIGRQTKTDENFVIKKLV